MGRVEWAQELAHRLLSKSLPERWAHTQGVARTAKEIGGIFGSADDAPAGAGTEADVDLLVSAAWLHDIGYAPALVRSGFHPLDGGRYLRGMIDTSAVLCRLVANHSFAIVEARQRGLGQVLATEFPDLPGLVADALAYCDLTTSPSGEPIDVESRLAEVYARFGANTSVAHSIDEARPHIRCTIDRIARLTGSASGSASLIAGAAGSR